MIELTLALIVVGTGGWAALLVWRKVPLLLQVPRQLIEESFVTRPSRLKHALESIAAFIREERYYDVFYASVIALLQWVRLRLLRSERSLSHFVNMMEIKLHTRGDDHQRFWNELKREQEPKPETTPLPVEEMPVVVVAAVMVPESVKHLEGMKESRPRRMVARAMDSVALRHPTSLRQKTRTLNNRISVKRMPKRTPPVPPEVPSAL